MDQPENFVLDTRIRLRALNKGLITAEGVEKHISSLQDLEGHYDVLDLEQPVGAREHASSPPPASPVEAPSAPELRMFDRPTPASPPAIQPTYEAPRPQFEPQKEVPEPVEAAADDEPDTLRRSGEDSDVAAAPPTPAAAALSADHESVPSADHESAPSADLEAAPSADLEAAPSADHESAPSADHESAPSADLESAPRATFSEPEPPTPMPDITQRAEDAAAEPPESPPRPATVAPPAGASSDGDTEVADNDWDANDEPTGVG